LDFRLELNIKPFQEKINIRQSVMLVGSCFTDHMGSRLRQHKFKVLENPNGIVFNPVSIANAIDSYISNRTYQADDLFFFNELWTSWDHHSQFSHPDQQICLQQINDAVTEANAFLQKADWLVITLGSSFIYELKDETWGGIAGDVAANCHKVPAQHFIHRLPAYAEVEAAMLRIVHSLQVFNPRLKIICTISPVRHFREGLVENNRSKALLHTAVHQLMQQFDHVVYFPAYELVIDDLRDYRFYAEDMVHPNHQATQYVWEKFSEAAIDAESRDLMKQLLSIYHAKNHRPLHAGSAQHQQFLQTMFGRVSQIARQYSFLDMHSELDYFSRQT
jgi:hypothetical protein